MTSSLPEVWREIFGFPSYKVSSLGRVKNVTNGRVLVGDVDRYGYRRVLLSGVRHKVHRLVCAAFHGPCPEGKQVGHLDGDSTNNAADNLAWVTAAENNRHKERHGTDQSGERHPRARLTREQAAEIRESARSHRALARQFGISISHVFRIKHGQAWAPRERPAVGRASLSREAL